MIKRYYIDTSVFGGYFDIEFEDSTRIFFQEIFDKKITFFIQR